MQDEQLLKLYQKLGVPLPTSDSHSVTDTAENPISAQLKNHRLEVQKWEMKGNELIGHTEMGTVRTLMPTDRIMVGTDDNNLPIFKKIGLHS